MGRLLLWDIDGTLLTASGASRAAMFAAASQVLEMPVDNVSMQTAGKTDPMIVRDLLNALGVQDDIDARVKKILRKFGPELARRRREITEKGQMFDGVKELMLEIDQTKTANTVLTGNIAVNAICKLDAFRLTPHFDLEIGGYGSDSSVRTDLVDVVLKRVADKRNRYFDNDEIWIIGDTPLDYEVAQKNQTNCLLVATGRHSFEELDSLGADLVLNDLTDTQMLFDLLSDPELKDAEKKRFDTEPPEK